MRNRQMSAVRPRDSVLSLNDRYRLVELLLTGNTGTADVFLDTGNTGLFPDGIDVGGTTTNYWANPPYWTPSGDHAYVIASGDTERKDFFDLSVLKAEGTHNFFFVSDFVFNADPATEETFIDAGANSTDGGWRINLSTTGTVYFAYREAAGPTLTNYGQIDLTARAGQRHVFGVYIDVQSETPQVKTRAWHAAGVTDVQQDDLPTPVPPVVSTQIVNIFARTGGSTQALGSASGITRINRARFYHLPKLDSSSKWEEIAEEMWHYPAEHKLKATNT